jgi:hypothetical protein
MLPPNRLIISLTTDRHLSPPIATGNPLEVASYLKIKKMRHVRKRALWVWWMESLGAI